MGNNNVTKFQYIIAGLEPAKKQALYQKMKSLPENERNEMIDKIVAVYETKKLKIEQPVTAGNIPPNNYGRTMPGRNERFSDRNTMWVDDRVKRNIKRDPARRTVNVSVNSRGGSAAAIQAVRRPGAMPPIQHRAQAVPMRAGSSAALVTRRTPVKKISSVSEAELKRQKSEAVRQAGKVALMVAGRASIVLVFTLVLVLCGFYSFLGILMRGPSPHIRDQFVSSVMESSMGGVFAKMILSDEEIAEILNRNKTQEFDTVTDTKLVNIADKNKAAAAAQAVNPYDPDGDGVEIHEVSGPMYHGVMMVVLDPSRVKVSALEEFNHRGAGYTLKEHIEKSGAIGGVNGGKYEDKGGMGIGGWPEGIVIADGKLRNGAPNATFDVYGFTKDNVLVVGRMTCQYALNMGVRDAVTFGPTLIVNGKAAKYSGNSGGLNPRTAIGQRADGAVLLLVIEGRKTSSMGATMADLIDVMKEYGAVNAANLDGGMSSAMWYKNEELVSSSSIRQSRKMPTAFVVLPQNAAAKAEKK